MRNKRRTDEEWLSLIQQCRSSGFSDRVWCEQNDISNNEEADFSKDLLLLMLQEYELFMDSFQFACKNFKGNTENADIAATIGFESNKEYNEIMFLREITHTVNAFNDMADVIRLYSKKPETATQRLANLLSEDSESV